MDPRFKFAALAVILLVGFSLVFFANTISDRPTFTPFGEDKDGNIKSASLTLVGIIMMSLVLVVAVRKHA